MPAVLATSIGTRIANVLDLRARFATGSSATDLIDPIFVPTGGQVVVDDPTCPTTMIGSTRGRDDALSAARIRARTLSRGLGRL